MVCDWKPDSSREPGEHRMPSLEGPAVLDHDIEDGEEAPYPINLSAYHLLPSDMQQGLEPNMDTSDSCESDSDSDASSSNDTGPSQAVQENPTHQLEGWEKSEINVDCDEIRSLMQGFSLPQSAVPDWAVTVPESDFSSFIWMKLAPNKT